MTDPIPQEAVEAGARAIYEMTQGAQIPGVVEGIEATHVGTANLSRATLTAAVPLLYAAWREALLSDESVKAAVHALPMTWTGDEKMGWFMNATRAALEAALATFPLPLPEGTLRDAIAEALRESDAKGWASPAVTLVEAKVAPFIAEAEKRGREQVARQAFIDIAKARRQGEKRGAEQRQAKIVKVLRESAPFGDLALVNDVADFIESLPTVEEEPG